MMITNEVKDKLILLYEWVWETGYDCSECKHKVLVHEPHGEVTRHCRLEDNPFDCPVVKNAIEENRVGGTKQ